MRQDFQGIREACLILFAKYCDYQFLYRFIFNDCMKYTDSIVLVLFSYFEYLKCFDSMMIDVHVDYSMLSYTLVNK